MGKYQGSEFDFANGYDFATYSVASGSGIASEPEAEADESDDTEVTDYASDLDEGIDYGSDDDLDDLLYEDKEPSRKAGFSYETDPVQKQFGEFEELTYPCIVIQETEQAGFEKRRMQVLSKLVNQDVDVTIYPLYLVYGSDMLELGTLDAKALRTLLTNDVFRNWDISIMLDKDTVYAGDMCLAFCAM